MPPEQLEELTRIVLKAVPAEKIFLLGSTLSQRRTATIFSKDTPIAWHIAHYYLLVLVKESDEANSRLQDKIENNCQHIIPVTALVLNAIQFNNWLFEGHLFACTVQKKAEVLYKAESNGQDDGPTIIDEADVKLKTEQCYTQGLNKVNEFLVGADLFRIRKQNTMAAFMLHQATEQALHTLLHVTIGLRVNTHNLDKLIRYGSMVSYKLPDIFARKTDKEKHLFNLLQSAYIHARYKEDYNIHVNELQKMVEIIMDLKEELSKIYGQSIY